MDGRVRPAVWIAASAALVATAVVLRLALPGSDRESRAEAVRVGSLARPQTRPAGAPGIRVRTEALEPRSAVRPLPALPASVAARGGGGSERAGIPPAQPRPQPADSRLASDLRVLEEEAARRAGSLGVAVPAAAEAAAVNPADASATTEDTQRGAVADAVLVDYLVQQAYRGTEFPIGFPAEERTRADAESRVSALTPELRLAMLRLALQTGDPPIAPRVDPFQIWEGAIH